MIKMELADFGNEFQIIKENRELERVAKNRIDEAFKEMAAKVDLWISTLPSEVQFEVHGLISNRLFVEDCV